MKTLLALQIIIFIATSSLHGQDQDWVSYSKESFSVKHPQDWKLNDSEKILPIFVIFSPLTSEQDKFSENINLLIQDLTGIDIDMNKYVKISESQIKNFMTDSKILFSQRLTSDSTKYHKIIYTAKQGEGNLKIEQYYWIINNKAYVLTLTCEESQFDNYKEIGEKILNSFKIKQ